MSEETKVLAAESAHWYTKQGEPMYEVPRASGEGTRPTTLADARKLDLVPSVTTILACAAKPGLEAWKARQVLEAALTLPKLPDETLDDYATRIIEDSKAQGKKAMERGTDLHAAIEDYIRGQQSLIWQKHCEKLDATLKQYGIDIQQGKPEHSFASSLGFGGKIDWHTNGVIIDFKTKAFLLDKKLAWPEHCWQLAAYAKGLFPNPAFWPNVRILNVFVGADDCEVRIHEWEMDDHRNGWLIFQHLFAFWQLSKNWNGTKL